MLIIRTILLFALEVVLRCCLPTHGETTVQQQCQNMPKITLIVTECFFTCCLYIFNGGHPEVVQHTVDLVCTCLYVHVFTCLYVSFEVLCVCIQVLISPLYIMPCKWYNLCFIHFLFLHPKAIHQVTCEQLSRINVTSSWAEDCCAAHHQMSSVPALQKGSY